MTGKKNRQSSIEKLWKLDDETLKTPRHDEMVIWLLNQENAVSIIPALNAFLREKQCVVSTLFRDEDDYERVLDTYSRWYAIVDNPTIRIESERPITTKTGFLVGYFDIVIECSNSISFGRCNNQDIRKYPNEIYIEVKPRIDSFGATLRQLRTYQQYEPNSMGNTYLFTDDLRFKDAFESQGIRVITRNNGVEE